MTSTSQKWLTLLGLFFTFGMGQGFAVWSDDPLPPSPSDDPKKIPNARPVYLGERKFRFGPGVSSVAFSPDGKSLATAGRWGLCVWDAGTGDLRFHHSDPELSTSCRALFSPDGKVVTLVHGHSAPMVLTYDAKTGKPLWRVDSHGSSAAAFSPDSKWLAVGNPGGRRQASHVGFLHVPTGQLGAFSANVATLAGLAFKPDEPLLALAQFDGTLIQRPYQGGGDTSDTLVGRQSISDLDYSPDGKLLVTCGRDGKIKVWDTEKLIQKGWVSLRGISFASVRFAPDGKSVAVGTEDGQIRLHDTSGKLIRRWQAHRDGRVCLGFSPDGNALVSGSTTESRVGIWDHSTGLESRKGGETLSTPAIGIAFTPEGSLLSWSQSGQMLAWSLEGGEVVSSTTHQKISAVSPDGRYLAFATGARVRLRARVGGKELPLAKPTDDVQPSVVGFSGNGTRFITTGYAGRQPDRASKAYCWAISGGQLVAERNLFDTHFRPPEGQPEDLFAVSPDGDRFALPIDNSIVVFETDSEEHRTLWPEMTVTRMALLPGGDRIVFAGFSTTHSRTIEVHDVKNRELIFRLTDQLDIGSGSDNTVLAVSPGGKSLAIGGAASSKVSVVDAKTGERLHTIDDVRGGVYSLEFSRDGKPLAIGDGTGGVQIEPIGEKD